MTGRLLWLLLDYICIKLKIKELKTGNFLPPETKRKGNFFETKEKRKSR